MDIGGGGGQGAPISHLVSGNITAEFWVATGGGGGHRGVNTMYHT